MVAMLGFFVQRFEPLLRELHRELPVQTRMLLLERPA